jgi:hypothetical protein
LIFMHEDVESLARVMRPPIHGGDQVDWAAWSSELGFQFPADYRSFMEEYGGGTIDDTLYLPGLMDGGASWRAEHSNAVEQLQFVDEERGQESPLPYPGRFQVGTLVFWGISPSADICCWYANGEDSDTWPVVVFRNRAYPEWVRYDGCFARFLESVICGRIGNPLGITLPASPGGADYLSDSDHKVLRQHGVRPRGYIHNRREVFDRIREAGLSPADFFPWAARLP